MSHNLNANVNHPSHYNQEGKKECIVAMREEFGDFAAYWFCKLNAYKYRYRAGSKPGNSAELDLAKATWYEDYATKTLLPTIIKSGADELHKAMNVCNQDLNSGKVLKEVAGDG